MKNIILLFSFLVTHLANCQIVDIQTNEKIPFAHIISDTGTLCGVTDIKGLIDFKKNV